MHQHDGQLSKRGPADKGEHSR